MIYVFEDFRLDTDRYEFMRGQERCNLEPQVFDLLRLLVEHHDRLVTKDEIIDAIWPHRFISDAALSSRVMAARKAVRDSGNQQRLIKTVHGRGFRFVGEVSTLEAEPTLAPDSNAVTGGPVSPEVAKSALAVRYAPTADGYSIAYTAHGEGPPIIRVPGWITHLEIESRWPASRAVWDRLAERHHVVRYDGRGFGLSDAAEEFSVETRVADLQAVIDAMGVDRVALLGTSASGVNTAVRFAASNPDMVTHLILYGGGANVLDEGEHIAWLREWRMHMQLMRLGWGKHIPIYRETMSKLILGLDAPDDDVTALTELHRIAGPAERAAKYITTSNDDQLPELAEKVRAPTLVAHRRDDRAIPLGRAKRLAQLIPHARLLVLDGDCHLMLHGRPGTEEFLETVDHFLANEV